jgi:hypothetical protein
LVHPHRIVVPIFNTKFRKEKSQELPRVALSLEKERCARFVLQALETTVQKRGLAHAGMGNEGKKAATGFDSMYK